MIKGLENIRILVTGGAGFIGSNLCEFLIEAGAYVRCLDNFSTGKRDNIIDLISNKNFELIEGDIINIDTCMQACDNIDYVLHHAALGSVPRSVKNPIQTNTVNISGFLNILESCRNFNIKHLIYASSSSVYGSNKKIPFSVADNVDNPISLYAATKKANELMAHTYSHLFELPTTGLRFFTVYGPWGRPDMALFLFTKAILRNDKIDVYNFGKMKRDFTYVDDIINGILNIIEGEKRKLYSIYNIGNNNTVELLNFIKIIEKKLGKRAQMNLLPIQPGDVSETWANVDNLIRDYKYKPTTKIEVGVSHFIDWYINYFNVEKEN